MAVNDTKQSLFARAVAQYENLGLREQRLIFFATPIMIIFLGSIWLLEPIIKHNQKIEQQTGYKRDQLTRIAETRQALVDQLATDPDEQIKAKIVRLNSRLDELNEKFSRELDLLVSPKAMPLLLRQLFSEASSLQLNTMKSIPPRPLFSELNAQQALFEHGIQLSFEGSYFATRDFLENAENLGWKLYWKKLEYQVGEYPNANTELELYTLSTQEAFIGVN
ncbi:hypothetical protein [Agaribacter flavus]|uniref:MSHA biogenesis protein MshJ n=1 Tax=Agaribacter flavus TaxID=1902781 RepID=A0ABV7FUF0_9ALTE